MPDSPALSDSAYVEFVDQGFTILTPDLEDGLHDHLYTAASNLYHLADTSKSPTAHLTILGDNLRAQVPAVDEVLHNPAVDSALNSLLGPDYLLHPHHFVHRSGSADQVFHQDGNLPWNERGHYRAHRPDWAMLFYYPQAVTMFNGPTEVMPGSQYWTMDIETPEGWHPGDPLDRDFADVMNHPDHTYRDQRLQSALENLPVHEHPRKFITVPKGSVVLAHYDLVHRGSRSTPDSLDRYMYKFYFARTRAPVIDNSRKLSLASVGERIRPVVRHVVHWAGHTITDSAQNIDDLESLQDQLHHGLEDDRVAAAYNLAAHAETEASAVTMLEQTLTRGDEGARRAAAYGLRAVGKAASQVLLTAMQHSHPGVRRMASFAMGNCTGANNLEIQQGLMDRVLSDPDDLVRSNAVYALGQIWRDGTEINTTHVDQLINQLKPGVEPNNSEVARMPRSTVRQSMAYALFLVGANGHLTSRQLSQLVKLCIDDADRYVQGFVIEIVQRVLAAEPEKLSVETLTRTVSHLNKAHLLPAPQPVTKDTFQLSR